MISKEDMEEFIELIEIMKTKYTYPHIDMLERIKESIELYENENDELQYKLNQIDGILNSGNSMGYILAMINKIIEGEQI